ncbi:pickpocket protein 11-like [Macrosteles quadrilineatus]|uniref:pickpocket protein 11-like n=1 Tax=Macrosteles quadrilineatus TaxID=74068 RepID=UPI0023E2A4F5|nr:pickpocket protein 11-like [Macrosteles quadrilineatus]
MCRKYGHRNHVPSNFWSEKHVQSNFDDKEFNNYMSELVPSCESESLITRLVVRSEPTVQRSRCDSNAFQQFYSPQKRICITFNSLRHKDIFQDNVATTIPMANTVNNKAQPWTFDNMMEFNGSLKSTPLYGLPLYAILLGNQQTADSENICEYAINEIVSITIHSPNEIPLNNGLVSEIRVYKNFTVDVLITPKITLARDLEQYTPQQRGCYFVHEKRLSMFKFYTKNNCDIECYINSTVSSCGCVPMLYPRPNKTVKVCVANCEPAAHNCGCLPDCNSLKYEYVTKDIPINKAVLRNITILGATEIGFKENYFYTNVRYSITSAKEFLAYTLGVLGAFLGFSVTCVWKLMYSGVARLCKCNYARAPTRKTITPLPSY